VTIDRAMVRARASILTAPEREALETAVDVHGMDDSGKCRCGIDLKGRYDWSDRHALEVAFLAGKARGTL
jgi:hypothetical protein